MIAVRPSSDGVESGLHLGLRLEVEVRRGLVEDEHPGAGQERPGQRDELALPRRQRHAALVHQRVDALGEPLDELGQADAVDRLHDLVVGGARPGEGDVVAHGAHEEERLLGDDAELPAQRVDGDVAQVVAVDRDLAARRVVEAGDELGDGRLARAGRPDQGDGLARCDVQVDVAQHRLRRVVGERDVVERDVAFDRRQRLARRRASSTLGCVDEQLVELGDRGLALLVQVVLLRPVTGSAGRTSSGRG